MYFTHAYAPSTNSAATTASIFTGQYPFEHKLATLNDHLGEKSITLAEQLIKKNFRTAFFSSGGNLYRKKGVDQGFEVFNDRINITHKKLFRNSEEINNLFKKWINKQKRNSTFSFLYYSDPLFVNSKTINNENVERSLTRDSQVEELSESVDDLINYLKKSKRWDNTMVVFLGLNGLSEKETVAKSDNLFSENMHIPLVIKPPKKKRDLGISWTIDKNVSLVDIGILLRDFFKINLNKSIALESQASVVESLEKPVSNWANDRIIVSESSWVSQIGNIFNKVAVRFGSILYFHKETPEIYNSLIDRQEISSVGGESYLFKKINKSLSNINIFKIKIWKELNSEKMVSDFANQFWIDKTEVNLWPKEFLLEESKKNNAFYFLFRDWLLKNKNWDLLEKLNNLKSDEDLKYIYSQYKKNYKTSVTLSVCLSSYLSDNKNVFSKNCKSNISQVLWAWKFEDNAKVKKNKLRQFKKLYQDKMLKRKVEITNIAFGYPWFYLENKFLQGEWEDKLIQLPEFEILLKEVNKFIY